MEMKNKMAFLRTDPGPGKIFAWVHLSENCFWWQCFNFSDWMKGVLWRNLVIPGEERGSRQLFQVCCGASTHLDALGGRICLQQWNMLWEWCLHWTESRWRAYFLGDAKNESKRSLSKDGMQFITKCKTVCSSIAHWWARDLHFVDWKGERGVLLSKYL